MIFDTIISPYDEHSESVLFLIDKFNVKKVIFIINRENERRIETSKESYRKLLKGIEIIFKPYTYSSIEEIKEILEENNKALINLTGGDRIISLLLLKISTKLGMQSVHIDFVNGRRYIFRDECTIVNNKLIDLSLDDLFTLSGARIISESTDINNKKYVIDISKKILSNVELWHKYKRYLYDSSIFKHNSKDVGNIDIDISKINIQEKKLINKCINYLSNIEVIEYSNKENLVHIKFIDNCIKGVILKSGTWLEVITYLAMKNIKEVDEVKSGVLFAWGEEAKSVKNEIDIVAIKNSVLICISCKDSDKYDDEALNELNVYSERLGGKEVIKILVASRRCEKSSVIQRAKEMNINLITLEGNPDNYLENTLRTIINGKIK